MAACSRSAGDIVVQGDATGNFNAYRANDGRKLWSFSVQTAVMAGPVSYEVDGEQYIAVVGRLGLGILASGWGIGSHVWKPAQREFACSAFKVGGGTASLPPLPAQEKLALNPPASTANSATIAHGNDLFGRYCSPGHGESAVGGGTVPDLRRFELPRQ